ncbi:OPT oligopeptide transporter protein-domain-containing protein [Thamnocephalis sphaerospora]|uniref:OPT oligopeptide transporter protein-domain-containing protein n=1 Tax=Thamnocephalis sphaerospora TaxID=78915 RepID=A0A4P9XVT8_9FUNG|nr:OPT oligopeptide transporter protein-domain-containing protein [Thamnocephalis sphaerospora]|eukprot:RKP10398.1 OPT oligopeptide transporter protein-domain-containing protein [Thamnocephalis sphaerospora]
MARETSEAERAEQPTDVATGLLPEKEDGSSESGEQSSISDSNDEDDSPYAAVRATVSNKDNTALPSLTFRFWIMAVPISIGTAFFNTIFSLRTFTISIGGVMVTLLTLPLGRFLARVLPNKEIGVGQFRFSLNPGPFNAKEHLLISICTSATGVAYALEIIVIKKIFYQSDTPLLGSLLLTLTTQCIGYGLTGFFYKLLVRPAAMIWPATLIDVAMYRAFHEQDGHGDQGAKRMRFFLITAGISALYYIVPGFLFTGLSTISILCLAMPNNLIANQIGSFTKGLGVLSFTLNWNSLVSSLGSPMAMPFWAIVNAFVGFVILAWIITPAGFYSNVWNAQQYGLLSSALYKADGEPYPSLELLNEDLSLNEEKYAEIGPPRISFMFANSYGIGFAAMAAIWVHIIIYHGKDMLQRIRTSRSTADDVHARLMDRYPTVPHSWYLITLVVSTVLAIFTCEYYDTQLPWWGVLLAIVTAAFFTLPIGIIRAVSGQAPGLDIITEFIIGYLLPGKPIANVTFKTYGFICMADTITLLKDLKIGHYMKVPPRHMFIAQMVGTLVPGTVNVLVTYLLFDMMPDLCFHKDWLCRAPRVFFSSSVVWGLIGPKRMFGPEGYYNALLWWFLVGGLLPIPFWLLSRRYPNSWVKYINVPVALTSVSGIPPSYTGAYPIWFLAGTLFQFYLFRYRQRWWSRYNFVLSAALDAGIAFTSFIIFFAFTNNGIGLDYWGTREDCPLLKNDP